jgi:hypothetical protein
MRAFDALWNLDMCNFHAINEGILILIPKTPEASTLKDYQPIALIHLVSKLFTKVLSNRLAPKLASLIHPTQSAFIKGHVIQDSFRYVHSVAMMLHVHNKPSLLLKVDIACAFDSVAWSFLLEIMQHIGFPQRWRDWTSTLLSSASTHVCLNGAQGTRICHAQASAKVTPSC